MYKITIENQEVDIEASDLMSLDISQVNDMMHVIDHNQSKVIKLLSCDIATKTVVMTIDGQEFSVKIADTYDQLLDQLGFMTESAVIIKDIKAPMPGLVLDILVEKGQVVEKGTQLVILEAMKMENVLKSQTDGVIESISVSKGDAVDKGQLLIVLE